MSYFVTTPLGREVALGDWRGLHRDTVLKVLHDFATSPFNSANGPLPLAAIVSVTGLRADDASSVCRELVTQGLIEIGGPEQYRITSSGIAFVRSTAVRAVSVGGLR